MVSDIAYTVSLALLALLVLGACSAIDVQNAVPFVPRPVTTKTMSVMESPSVAYERSVTTIKAMGGMLTQLEPDAYRISAQMYGAVAFNVAVTPSPSGSVLTASQRVSDGHIAYAPVRVCEQFFAAYRGEGRP